MKPSPEHALTHAQTQIWIGQRLHPESPLYNMAFVFVFPAELRADLFAEAFRRVVAASDALRTRILEQPGGSLRRVVATTGPALQQLGLGSHPDPAVELRSICRRRCAVPLALDGDLVDSVLVRLGDGRTAWYLNQHHLIADAWSTQLLYRRVSAEYEALREAELGGAESPPPAAGEASYYRVAAALATPASPGRAAEREKAHDHWQARRAHPRPPVPLYGRSALPSGTESSRRTLEIDEARSWAIDRLCSQPGLVSLSPELSRFAFFAALLAGWLHRVGGVADPGFDAPVAGRPTAEAKNTLGLFIEVFPFAVTVAEQDSFRSLAARCLEEAKLFLRHALPGLSSPSSRAASNVVLNYFPAAFGPFAGLPAEVEWVHPGHGDSVHALRLQVHDFAGTGRYVLHFDFNRQALPAPLQRRGLEHFSRLLDACLAAPDGLLAAVDLRTEEEKRGWKAFHQGTEAPPAERTVVQLFEARAALEPDVVALREGGAELCFGDLRRRSETMAAALVERGVAAGDRVAVDGRRSISTVVAILAILRARAAYVPIEPSLPPARRREILVDCGARLLLVATAEKGEGPADLGLPDLGLPDLGLPDRSIAGVEPLVIDEGVRAGDGLRLEAPGPGLDELAYLIYTSGSTGRPKGVPIDHRGLSEYLGWASRLYVRGDRLRFPLFTSLAFDLTVTSLFLPLITGGTLEIYPQPPGPADTALLDVVRANAVDFIKLTPSHLSLLVRMGLEGSRLRRMVVGGENLPARLAASISAQLHDRVEIYNEYGPTEAVVGCVVHRYDPAADAGDSVPIGRPADGVAVEVLTPALVPVPAGVPGELWISRRGLARGYHGRPGLTAERFQPRPPDPLSGPLSGLLSGPLSGTKAGERRYRSGDRVRLDEQGVLEYLGRLDRQLKVSGFRVEPGEIEAALRSLPGVEQCAVVARRRPAASATAQEAPRFCARCGLSSSYPRAVFDDEGVCSVCRSYEAVKDHAQAYFKTMDDLRAVFEESARRPSPAAIAGPRYDCMMLFSGGKDSTYALCRLVEMGLSVYAFTLDNGFIAEGAKDNIRRVAAQLGVPVEFATTSAMNAIFRDSLMRFANVCNGCFKTIYTLSLQRARELCIPIIVTGLSRGQMFETRLTEEMFRDGRRSAEEIDAAVLAARKVYHRVADEVSRSLDVGLFEDDRIFEEIRFVDFYRYCDVGLDEVLSYLRREVPWVRPEDTGRSTNCLINDLGIFLHKKERGYHNYALPYSWDVRLGHKSRAAALAELDDDIDVEYVRRTLRQIGYDETEVVARVDSAAPGVEAAGGSMLDAAALEAFYVASEEVPEEELRRRLAERLPAPLIPGHLRRVAEIPLTSSGKVDERALLREAGRRSRRPYRAPEGPVQELLADLWRQQLWVERVGADDHFFELGGTSLAALQVMLRLCEELDLDLPLDTMFTHPVLGALAKLAEDRLLADVAALSDAERERLLGAEPVP